MMKKLVSLTLILVMLVAVAPQAGAQSDDQETIVSFVAKLGPTNDAQDMAQQIDARRVEALLPSLGVFEFDVAVNADKKLELDKVLKEYSGHKELLWAEWSSASVAHDTRFFAWPSGAMTPEFGDDLPPLFGEGELERVHQVARGSGIRVAVLDTGIDPFHEAYAGMLVGGRDLIDDDQDPSEERDLLDTNDDGTIDGAFGHGTFVAGVIAQVAPEAEIVPVRVLDSDGVGQLYSILEGIDYAISQDVDIINISFGLHSEEKLKILEERLKQLKKEGVLVVVAAGNASTDKLAFIARSKEVLTVGASSATSVLSHFSNRGGKVDVSAPGVGIVSAYPGGSWVQWDGTSFAAPVVTGQLALLASTGWEEKPKEWIKAVTDSAERESGRGRTKKGTVQLEASFERLAD